MPSVNLRRVRKKQRGYAVMLVLVFMVMGSLTYLVRSVSKIESILDRDAITQAALAEAKEALIAWAVTKADEGPGYMVCPDDYDPNHVDQWRVGTSKGALCSVHIGRLPWKTLEIPELRDSSGETLWYAVSPTFRNLSVNGPINSDSAGELTISAYAGIPAVKESDENGIVAIIFAPGPPLPGQSRVPGTLTSVANYLEGENADNNQQFERRPRSGSFNDQVILIREDELLAAAERAIAAQLAAALSHYSDTWQDASGRALFPYAAPDLSLPSPTLDPFCGSAPASGQIAAGRLPFSTASSCAPSLGAEDFDHLLNESRILNSWCDEDNPALPADRQPDASRVFAAICTIVYDAASSSDPFIATIINLPVNDIGKRFVLPVQASELRFGDPPYTAAVSGQVPGMDHILPGLGNAVVRLFVLVGDSNAGTFKVVIPMYDLRDRLPTNISLEAFFNNEWWYHSIYYVAAAQQLANSSGSACTMNVNCLSVFGMPSYPSDSNKKKEALLVTPGSRLLGKDRTPYSVTGYLENGHASMLEAGFNREFEKNTRRAAFNDQVFAIAP